MNKKSLIIIFSFLILFSCSKSDPVTGEKVIIEPDPTKRAAKIRDEGGGILVTSIKLGKDPIHLILHLQMLYGEPH